MTTHLPIEQILIFSRHGIRTPLPNTIDFLKTVTPKNWPQWDCEAGYLTTRGGTLESYFGDYFLKWLKQNQVNLSPEDIFFYSNSLQRTVATAQYLSLGAFAGLDITINHKYTIEQMDPIFDPVIRDSSPDFKTEIIDDLKNYTRSSHMIENLNQALSPVYDLLSDILDYKYSTLYQKYQCELRELPTTIDMVKNKEPILLGPLAICTAIADAFTLQYYSAFDNSDVAWGMIENDKQWQLITNIKNQYINLLFKSPKIAHHIGKPLIEFINDVFNAKKHKLNVLVGHDSNIATLLGVLGFDEYELPEQHEKTPIGGKVVFIRYYEKDTSQHYFKAEYIYQSFEQIHLGLPLSLNNPPKHISLTLSGVKPNAQGLYLWDEFSTRINQYLTKH